MTVEGGDTMNIVGEDGDAVEEWVDHGPDVIGKDRPRPLIY